MITISFHSIDPLFGVRISEKSSFPIISSSKRFIFIPNSLTIWDSKISYKIGYFLSSTNSNREYADSEKINNPEEGIFISIIDLKKIEYLKSISLNFKNVIALQISVPSFDNFILMLVKIFNVLNNEIMMFISCYLI